jgi:hypothetical protein
MSYLDVKSISCGVGQPTGWSFNMDDKVIKICPETKSPTTVANGSSGYYNTDVHPASLPVKEVRVQNPRSEMKSAYPSLDPTGRTDGAPMWQSVKAVEMARWNKIGTCLIDNQVALGKTLWGQAVFSWYVTYEPSVEAAFRSRDQGMAAVMGSVYRNFEEILSKLPIQEANAARSFFKACMV